MAQILQTLEQRNPRTTTEFTNLVQDYDFDGRATAEELANFVGYAMLYHEGKKGPTPRNQKRLDALLALRQFARKQYGTRTAFPGLDFNRVVYQLAIRVVEPRRFNQTKFGLCGPSHFALVLIKTQPDRYVDLASDLLTRGKAEWDGMDVAPNPEIRSYVPGLNIPEADWLIAGSLRSSKRSLARSIAEYDHTPPNLVFHWFAKAGYSQVVLLTAHQDKFDGLGKLVAKGSYVAVHGDPPEFMKNDWREPLKNLILASSLADGGWSVLMKVNEGWSQHVAKSPERVLSERDRQAAVMWEQFAKLPSDVQDAMRPQFADRVAAIRIDVPDAAKRAERRKELEAELRSPPESFAGVLTKPRYNHWIFARKVVLDGNVVKVKQYTWGAKEWTEPFALDAFCAGYGGFVAARL